MRYGLLLGAAAVFGLISTSASAQWNNQPFQFRSQGGIGSGVGMSLAYRQAILEEKFSGSRPDQMYRDAAGALLTVERRGAQVFLRETVAPYIATQTTSGAFVGGSGIGAPIYGGLNGVNGLGTWTGMVGNVSTFNVAWASLSPASSSPVNAWIGQLDGF